MPTLDDRSVCPGDAEIDQIEHRLTGGRGGEGGEAGPGGRAVTSGALERGSDRAVALEQTLSRAEVGRGLLEVGQGALPEGPLALVAASVGQEDRQGDLALAEIVADRLAELCLPGAVVERVVDQLEGDADVLAVGRERRLLGLGPVGDDGTDLGRPP